MEPLVTVIVPVYNVAPYLREALDSVIGQRYKNLEILVVDDGSTDESGQLCDDYLRDPRVRVIHQRNRGLSAARNVGLDRMTGEYLAFLDPDDAFHPEMISRMMHAMAGSGADMVACCYQVFSATGPLDRARPVRRFVMEGRLRSTTEALNDLIAGELNQSVWNKLYRRELWDGLRFPEGYVYEDVRTTYRVIEKAKQIQTLPDCLYKNRKRPGSITATPSPRNILDCAAAKHILEEYVTAHTPAIFKPEIAKKYKRDTLRGDMLECAEILRASEARADAEIQEWIEAVRAKARRASDMQGIKNRFVQRLFFTCPGLLPFARKIYRAGKDFVKRMLPL